jgi:predicted peptidase
MRRSIVAAVLVVATVGAALLISAPRLRHSARSAVASITEPPAPAFEVTATPTLGGFSGRTYEENGVVYRYQIFFPSGYDASRKWPVVVAIHGSAEKGDDGMRQIGVGVGPVVRSRATTFPAVVVFPQVPRDVKVLRFVPTLSRLIDSAIRDANGDSTRLYLTGLSLGGDLAYHLAHDAPGRFAAVVPVSAPLIFQAADGHTHLPKESTNAEEARALHGTPVWIFHGANDGSVAVADTRAIVAAFKAAGDAVIYTEYADGSHEIWDRAYRTPELWSWLWAQHR